MNGHNLKLIINTFILLSPCAVPETQVSPILRLAGRTSVDERPFSRLTSTTFNPYPSYLLLAMVRLFFLSRE